MIATLRYLVSLVIFTARRGLQSIVPAIFGVKFRPGGVYDRAGRGWGRDMLRGIGADVSIEGLDRLEPGRSYVYAANHASFLDVWLLFALLPGSVRFVAKKELLRIPFFGRAIRASGQIPIDRGNLREAFSAYDEAAAAIRRGLSAIVFAEGTRSRDGSIRPFKKGPFVLAIAAGAPVVPVRIEGTFRALPPGSWRPRRVPVRVRLGDPIPTEGMQYDDRGHLAEQTRAAVLALG